MTLGSSYTYPPTLVQTVRRKSKVISALLLPVWMALWWWFLISDLTRPHSLVTIVIVLAVYGLTWDVVKGVTALREQRLKRKATEMDFAMCCVCAYSLQGHGDEPRCPECGWYYDNIEQVRGTWRYWEPKKAPRWFRGVQALIARLRG